MRGQGAIASAANIGAGGGGGGYVAKAVTFDWTAGQAYITSGLGTLPDSAVVSGCFWLQIDAAGYANGITCGGNGTDTATDFIEVMASWYNVNSDLFCDLGSDFLNNAYVCVTDAGIVSADVWMPFFFAYDPNHAIGSRRAIFFLGDVNANMAPVHELGAAFLIPFSTAGFAVPTARPEDAGLVSVSNYWMDNQFIDWTDVSNRRKFLSALGKPVDLGADGSIPFGSPPIVFLEGDSSPTGFMKNKGTAGDIFTLHIDAGGSLTNASTSPSD